MTTTGPPVAASAATTAAVAGSTGVMTVPVVPVVTTTAPPAAASAVTTGTATGTVGPGVTMTVVVTGVVSSATTVLEARVVMMTGLPVVGSAVMTTVAVASVAAVSAVTTSGGGFRRDDNRGGGFRRDDRGGDRSRGGYRGGQRDDRDRGGFRRDDRDRDREPIKRLPIPEDVTGDEIDKDVRQELMSLPKTLAEDVARNLVMVARLIDEDPEEAYAYSRIALRLASRVAAVREAAGFAAYATQKYSEALAEFRAARRMTGSVELWPVMADCERGLGRPEKALAMAGEPEVQKLDKAGQVEMRLVAAGARRDMGQIDAAIVTLQSSELASHSVQPWTARLRYAYADALLEVGREDEAREWFGKALEADKDGSTDASDRLAELDGVEFVDVLDEEADTADTSGTARTAEADDETGSAPEGRDEQDRPAAN